MPEKPKGLDSKRNDDVELETQVILRMPEEPARVLRDILREGGANLKDRLKVKFESDLRYGEVRLDHWLMYAKLVDIPTVIESLKTIDNKSFYKTADICQMLMCRDEPEQPTTDDESPTKNKKKDPNKVDKKFLWPHGVTPPCKNIRKRRFRKTLKKKYVEAPEIEKEVKRLLRADNEAVNVKWEIVKEEEDPNKSMEHNEEGDSQSMAASSAGPSEKHTKKGKGAGNKGSDSMMPRDIDIFGEDLTSSDDEGNNINVELDETSRLSAEDSRQSDYSNSMPGPSMVTEFNKQMFGLSPRSRQDSSNMEPPHTPPRRAMGHDYSEGDRQESNDSFSMPQMSQGEISAKIGDLRRQLSDLHDQRLQKEQEISSIENQTLRQRMQDNLDNVLGQILDREMELQEFQSMQS